MHTCTYAQGDTTHPYTLARISTKMLLTCSLTYSLTYSFTSSQAPASRTFSTPESLPSVEENKPLSQERLLRQGQTGAAASNVGKLTSFASSLASTLESSNFERCVWVVCVSVFVFGEVGGFRGGFGVEKYDGVLVRPARAALRLQG